MLDDIKTYEAFDPKELNFSIERLPEDLMRGWEGVQELSARTLPKDLRSVVVVADESTVLLLDAFLDALRAELNCSVTLLTGGALPRFVRNTTLVIGMSMDGSGFVSGALASAKQKKAKVVCVGGAALKKVATKLSVPFFGMDADEDADRARVHGGFFAGTFLGVLHIAGVAKIGKARMRLLTRAMIDVIDSCDITVVLEENPAKTVSSALDGMPVLLAGSAHLSAARGALGSWLFSVAGLSTAEYSLQKYSAFARGDVTAWRVLALRSNLYETLDERELREGVDALEELGAEVIDYEARGASALEEVAEVVQFGYFLAYYCALRSKRSVS